MQFAYGSAWKKEQGDASALPVGRCKAELSFDPSILAFDKVK